MRLLSLLPIVFQIALRSLLARRSTLLIGGFLAVCSAYLTLASGVRMEFERASRDALAESFVGHFHLFSTDTRGELQLFPTSGGTRFQPIRSAERVREEVAGLDNVRNVVPIGRGSAAVVWGNVVDRALAHLRQEVQSGAAGTPEGVRRIEAAKAHVRFLAAGLITDLEAEKSLVDPVWYRDDMGVLDRSVSDELWASFDQEPLAILEFLDSRLAPLAAPEIRWHSRFIGVELADLRSEFDTVEIVDGSFISPGERGILLSKLKYESTIKLQTARALDRLRDALEDPEQRIEGDPYLAELLQVAESRVRDILLQLDAERASALAERLRRALGVEETRLPELLRELVTVNDENFAERYRIFYAELPAFVDLYWARIGDEITLRAPTNTGYVRTVKVKLFGTFKQKGLHYEAAPLCNFDVVDLGTLRHLYGYLDETQRREIAALGLDAEQVPTDRAAVELALLQPGEDDGTFLAQGIDEAALLAPTTSPKTTAEQLRPDDSSDVVLGFAVLLRDGARVDETLAQVRALVAEKGHDVVAVPWEQAAGDDGALAVAIMFMLSASVNLLLFIACSVILCVTMVVTLRRISEVGTYRALGASPVFVLSLVTVEAVASALVFGGLGTLAGMVYANYLGDLGLPFGNEFSGLIGRPELRPVVGASDALTALTVIVVVTVLSFIIPAIVASCVSPIRAMQTEE